MGNFVNVEKTHITLTTLYASYIGAVEIADESESLLRQPFCYANSP